MGKANRGKRTARRTSKQRAKRWLRNMSAGIIAGALTLVLGGSPALSRCSRVQSAVESIVGTSASNTVSVASLGDIPEYSDSLWVCIDADGAHAQGTPSFSDEEVARAKQGSFLQFSDLDSLSRCGTAFARLGTDTLSYEERQSIRSVYPSGWVQHRYSFVDGGGLYNRSHLIAHALCGENANEKNLITGTRAMNTEAMTTFENQTARYIEDTGNHVLYRVTPMFEEGELVARGVHMEAQSVEDGGAGLSFNVYCYNVQPGVTIDYTTGENHAT
jgi:DNA-entry nuclease